MFQNDAIDVFHVFLAGDDKKSFTYNRQTTVAVSKTHEFLPLLAFFFVSSNNKIYQ